MTTASKSPADKETDMTAAQIKTSTEEIAALLELTLGDGPLDATTTPITTELTGAGLEITLHACIAGTGDDVKIRATIDADGNVDSYHGRTWDGFEMSPWDLVNSPASYLGL